MAEIKEGDLVLLNYANNLAFKDCILAVEEVKSWGVQGYVQTLGENRHTMGGKAYYRAEWEEFVKVGNINCIL